MTGSYVFPKQRFFEVLLAGARQGFLRLQVRHSGERVYQCMLVLSAGFDCIEPGINTEEVLRREVERMKRALSARGIEAVPGDVAKALRFGVPGPDYRAAAHSDDALAEANRLLAEFGARYAHALVREARLVQDADGSLIAETPLDDLLADVLNVPYEVLRALDREEAFGTGAARERLVLDLAWFEGGRPDAWAHAAGIQAEPPSPLNPPAVQTRYAQELAEGAALSQRLFTSRSRQE